ncbi:MAG: YybH family protein [Thalassotalea sp.]
MRRLITLLTLLATTQIAWAKNDNGAITQVINNYQAALNASSTKDVIKLYSPEATFMPQHAPAQIGQAMIKKAYEQVFKTIELDIAFTVHNIEVHGDTAWVRTSSAGKTTILANKMIINEGNNELFIFKNHHGDWKIHQYIFSTNQARP